MVELSNKEKSRIELYAKIITGKILETTNLSTVKDPFNKFSEINKAFDDIILIRFPSKCEKLSGFYLNIDKYKCIYINSAHTLGRQYCSFWHEIYHAIDDESEVNVNLDDDEEDDLIEKRANQFSYCMLLPEIDVKNYIVKLSKNYFELDIYDIVKMQFYFRTSLLVLLFRLKEIYKNNYFLKFKEYSSVENIKEYQGIVKNLGFSMELILPTNDVIVPKMFFKDVHDNIYNNRISLEKAQELMDIIEEKGVESIW